MKQEVVLDGIYTVLFIAVACSEYFHIVPQGTALALLTGVVVGMKTQSLKGSSNV